MKHQTWNMRIPFLLLATVAVLAAEADPKPVESVSELIRALPPQSVLSEARQLLRNEAAGVSESKERSPGALERASANVREAERVIPELRKRIKVGASIFDYPGLLSRGLIGWNEQSKDYTMYLGVGTIGGQGREPYAMHVTFDD